MAIIRNGFSFRIEFFLLVLIASFPLSGFAQEAGVPTADELDHIKQLQALGYIGATATDSKKAGVTKIELDLVNPGFRLFNSSHGPVAHLIDVHGKVLHTWSAKPWEVGPEFNRAYKANGESFRKVRLLEKGSLLGIYDGIGLVKLDKDSKVVWSVQNRAHHDLDIAENGDIYVLRHYTRMIPRVNENELVVDDMIAILDSNGREKDAISILEAFENSERYSHLWEEHHKRDADVIHPNAVRILDGSMGDSLPAFKKGNLLISIAYMKAVIVLDPEKREVVWGHVGPYEIQHDSRILDNENLLVFDNRGIWPDSRVLELKVPSMEVAWSFVGSESNPFSSGSCGTSQRLPNGNTLIAETEGGRAIEVTAAGDIVWEFYNPHRKSEDEISWIFEMYWLPENTERFWE